IWWLKYLTWPAAQAAALGDDGPLVAALPIAVSAGFTLHFLRCTKSHYVDSKRFADANQFSLNGDSKEYGNSVLLVSDTRSIPCDVERDSTHSNQITCNTRTMPEDDFVVRVSIDGVPIPENNICYGYYKPYWCSFYPRSYRTPTIRSLIPLSGLPGTLITMEGHIFTNVYGSNTAKSSNGLDVRVLRYGLNLSSEFSEWGTITCKMTGTYVGHHNLSFILDSEFGRSLPDRQTYIVSSLNKLAMFQTYAEVTKVSPSVGSLEGGTILTIDGHFFDQTDYPATVLLGVVLHSINVKHFQYGLAGGRGLKMEMWNNSRPAQLDDVLTYNESRPGYSVQWMDSLTYTWPLEMDDFVARISGFVVPPETDNYTFYIMGDDRYALYFSKTGNPKDKVKIAYMNYVASSFFSYSTQKSETMRLEKGVPYYMEVLLQEYKIVASVAVGLFKEKSYFTAQQTPEAINEVQVLMASYDILNERQVLTFENWTAGEAVSEVQSITIISTCFELDSCGYTYYSLIYNSERTGKSARLAVSASAEGVQNALNALWSIQPDTVHVTKVDTVQGSEYKITFNSKRGDFQTLSYETPDLDVNITVIELTKGKPNLETFTLQWGGVLSKPIGYGAPESEIRAALESMLAAECPRELQVQENNQVIYFRDYEVQNPMDWYNERGTRVLDSEAFCGRYSLKSPDILFQYTDWRSSGGDYGPIPLQTYGKLCFAYKGWLKGEIGLNFSYKDTSGYTNSATYMLTIPIKGGIVWNYICVDLLSSLETAYPGSDHSLLNLYMYRETVSQDFFVDVVYIGRAAIALDINEVLQRRRPPALAGQGLFLQSISVLKHQGAEALSVSYEIIATPLNCGHDFPLLAMEFLQVFNSSGDVAMFGYGGAGVTITRLQKASPPLSGTFDVEIYSTSIKGLPVDITAEDLQYALQGVLAAGQLSISRYGSCQGYTWTIEWRSNPGSQPLIQVNSSSVIGVNPRVVAYSQRKGGLFKSNILGDFLRVPESKPQVQVIINGIPSKCSGDCGFEWKASSTPTITGISPSQGSYALGTNLTITGTGFASENATVLVGNIECMVLQISGVSLTCSIGQASAGTYPISLSFSSLGLAQHAGGTVFSFTNQMGASAISQAVGSVTGGTLLTVFGYGFRNDTVVLIGTGRCTIVVASLDQLKCRTPPGTLGTFAISLQMDGMTVPLNLTFTYNDTLIPLIADWNPKITNVIGNQTLTILGSNFQDHANDNMVHIGEVECRVLHWSSNNITCLLPRLPPALYSVHVQLGKWGYAQNSNNVNTTVEYVLQVTGIYPSQGSLYGGTKVTVTGSGFSSSITDNLITVGDANCKVTTANENQVQCVIQPNEKTFTVTNLGIHPDYGVGYMWSPSSLMVQVGDTVAWSWEAPAFVPGLGYRVYSVPSPSSTTHDGVAFSSGDTKTQSGFFSYRFTVPGIYYYSSGFVDVGLQRFLQGMVEVRPVQDRSSPLNFTVGGIEANHKPGEQHSSREESECLSTPPDCFQNLESSQPSDVFSFSFLNCLSPTVYRISPDRGTFHTIIYLEGVGFSNISCANEVSIGGQACHVINSTTTEINCQLAPDSGLEIGLPHLISVRVNNFGKAITSVANEFGRRFVVLPVVDSVMPGIGATTGHTRLVIQGSGFSAIQDTMVNVAGVPCSVLSINYTTITCNTSPSWEHRGSVVVLTGSVSSSCLDNCNYQFSSLLVPHIDNVSPSSISGNLTTVIVAGIGFGSQPDDVAVFADGTVLEVMEVTNSNITLAVGPLPAGNHALMVVIMSKGLASGNATLRSLPIAVLTPTSGSTMGGTPLLITGNGFMRGSTFVTVGGAACLIQWMEPDKVYCLTSAHREGSVAVQIQVLSVAYPALTFNYSLADTPAIIAVSPTTGPGGTVVTITGSGFGTDPQKISVTIDHTPCPVTTVTDTEIQCTAGEHAGGTFPIMLYHSVKGYASSQAHFTYELLLKGVVPEKGGFGGGTILEVQGSGFDPDISHVRVCGNNCSMAQQPCTVEVLNRNAQVNVSNGFTYMASLTPVITGVTPRRGGTAGGTKLTITGSGFSTNSSEVNVTIAGSICDINFVNSTHIICITNTQTQPQQTKVQVSIGNRGIAKMDNADFFYIDVWSSKYTWGGLSPPEAGMFVVITKGQTILLDTSTPVLKMLLIQGGTLVFDEADIELQAENILITDGGHLQVGTETAPFQHKAIITLHGHLRSQELPIYGTKTLAIREGVLDLHGIPVPVPWTHLNETASAGSVTLSLRQAVTWRPGDQIVIASTGHRHSQNENEVKTIASMSADGRTLNLTEPLAYTHLGVTVTLSDGTIFEGRAEVGLLTRNIVVRGSNNIEWADTIQACPAGFNTGEFATQTCFQGRFGEEIGSDQFGGCIMFHAPRPNENLAIGRLEYVEVFHAGQAFRLGRYPIHWHLMGNIQYKSYVRGCAIHQTYNRAVTIHNTHNLLVEHNVIYDIMGGAFFIEDGIETGNILQYNLAVFVKQSTSLLNDDVTPAAYWVTNPNNIIRHNAAAGGTHFGFWYRMHDQPDGPSYDPNICQKRVPLGEFFNNTVHSQGWFGLWIFQEYFPMIDGHCYSWIPQPAIFRSLTTWNCEKGAEWVNVGAVHFSNFLMVNNEKAGIESKRIISWTVRGWGETGGALVQNSTIVGHMDELGLGSSYCTSRGVILPLDDGMSILSTTFMNFDRPTCAAIGVTSIDGTCTDRCGGWSKVGHKVVPQSPLLDPSHCSQQAEWSVGFPGSECDSTVKFHRLVCNNPSPSSLNAKAILLTNSHGTSVVPYLKKLITHTMGWMALLPSSDSYNWYFNGMEFISDLSYSAIFYGFKEEDYVIINHNMTQIPDRFLVVDNRNASTLPLNFSKNQNGDWYLNETTKTVYYMAACCMGKNSSPFLVRRMTSRLLQYTKVSQVSDTSVLPTVSGKGAPNWRSSSVDLQVKDIAVNFQMYHCFYKGCIPPSSPPATSTLPPVPSRKPVNYVLTVLGVLEIPDTMNDTSTTAKSSAALYRSVVVNATYILIQGGTLIAGWPDNPFKGELRIILRGNHHTPEWPLTFGPNLGAKVLGVLGTLDLYGMPHSVYHTKLASTAPVGSNTLFLQDAVDWQVGDEIVISTTGYDPWQTETRMITAVSTSGLTLTLNQSLSYTHSGESFNVSGTKKSYTLAGDVGLLSRNIKIIGEDYPDWYKESFGARVLVGSSIYRGRAQIRNVEFYHTGQYGYPDPSDPRYSLAFLNLGEVSVNESCIQGCSFHQGFSPAIGVFGTDGLNIDDNVIYFTVGEGIRVWGNNNKVRRNLVTLSVWPGAYQDREEAFNFQWNAAIEVNEGRNVILQDNTVAGYERVGYRINGEPCPGTLNIAEHWHTNEAHGGLYGVYMNKDGLATCSLIQGFYIWRSFDYGVYFQVSMNVEVSNITLVDNGMGISSYIYSPPSVYHLYSNKHVHIQDALIVGTSPNLNCSEVLSSSDTNIRLSSEHRAPRTLDGGRSGICWPTFESDHNHAPEKPHNGIMSYNGISGLLTVTDTVFVGFGYICPKQISVMFMTDPNNEDLQHPVHVERITIANSTEDAKVFIHRPDVRLVNPSDCVDMDCDAKKKALLKDLDGSFLGSVGAVVPQSEFEWNGDKRRGLGDYRIPKVMLTYLNGSRIPVNQIAPNKGVIRDSSCTYMAAWQSYKCFHLNYEMLVIESLDSDTETRRLSPVALLGDGYVDLLNEMASCVKPVLIRKWSYVKVCLPMLYLGKGPQDHGWCAGYTCQRRVSLFHSIIATNKSFDIFFTSTSPQKLRLMLLNADNSKAVRVAVFYSNPQRLDVYVNNSLVAPTNAIWNSDKTDYTLQEPSFEGQFLPHLDSAADGANYFDSIYKMLNVLVRGPTPVEIRTSPLLFIAFQLPAMTAEQFFADNLVRNLALFLKIPANMIRVTKVIREGQRRRRAIGLSVEVQIAHPPVQQATNGTYEESNFSTLSAIADNLGQSAVSGNLSQSIGFTVSSVGITLPTPPPSNPKWSEVVNAPVTRQDPSVSIVSTVSTLVVVVEPMATEFGGPLVQQPSIMAVDGQGSCVSVGVTSLTLTAILKDTNNNSMSGLVGNTTIPFDSCWANYTDLYINAT
ncbi:fibrocystin-L-like, partial [Scleropages formosus]